MSGVIDVLGWEESVWFVELVKLLGCKLHVVLDAIAILIVDWLSERTLSSRSLEHDQVQVLRRLNHLVVFVKRLLRLRPIVNVE